MAVVPVFVMLGEGIFCGGHPQQFLLDNQDLDYVWSARMLLPPPQQKNIFIYNHDTGAWVTYTELVSNTEWTPPNDTYHGPDVTLVDPLADLHPSGIYLFKYTLPGAINTGNAPRWAKLRNERYGSMLTAKAAAFAALASSGHTPDVKALFLSFGYSEGIAGNSLATFPADLELLARDLRADWTTTTQPAIVFERPSPYKAWITGQVESIRDAIEVTAANIGSAKVANSDDIPLDVSRNYPTGIGYMQLGMRLFEGYRAIIDPIEYTSGNGVPVYFYLGQSQVRGTTSIAALLIDRDPRHVGAQNGQWIWDGNLTRWSLYDSQSNANTVGVGSSNVYGPELTLLRKLYERHPGGVFLIKVGYDGSCLGAPDGGTPYSWGKQYNVIWPVLEATWYQARAYLLNNMGLTPAVSGIFWHQGESDTDPTRSAAYAANLKKFVADVRGLVTTRVAPPDVPFIIARLINTGGFSQTGVAAVRAAQDGYAAIDPQAKVVDLDDDEWLYPIAADRIHHTGFATINIGRALAAALDSVDMGCSAIDPGASDGAGLSVSGFTVTEATTISATLTLGGSNTLNLVRTTALYRSNSRRVTVLLVDSAGLPIDLTGASATWALYPALGNTTGQVSLASGGLGISLNAPTGTIQIDIPAASMATVGSATARTYWRHDLILTLGSAVQTIAQGVVEIRP